LENKIYKPFGKFNHIMKITVSVSIKFFICFFTLFLFADFSAFVCAQDLTPEKMRLYTTADGMRNDFSFCMDQDKDGNLWIGTLTGANKFDGRSFTNYGEKHGFTDKWVWAVLCDSSGLIWFGTGGDGLFCFDGKIWKQFTKKSHGLSSDNFFNGFLYEDSQGNIWGGKANVNVFKYSNGKFEFMDFDGKGADEDSNGNLFITERHKNLHFLKKGENNFKIINNKFDSLEDIAIDSNKIWVGSNNLIAKSTDSGKTFIKFKYDANKISSENVLLDMFIDSNNQIWTGNSNFVTRFDGSKFHYYNKKNGLPDGFYSYIFQDKHGHLWFCTPGGIAKFDNIAPKLELTSKIPGIIKSQTLSFQLTGNDGKFGTPGQDLIFEYKFSEDKKWQKAPNGRVNLHNLQNKKYKILLKVTDGFQNSAEKSVSFRVQLDNDAPAVIILNKNDFLKPLEKPDFEFYFTGTDNMTDPKDLVFKYKLEKEGKIIEDWPKNWLENRQTACFKNQKSGDYTFFIQTKDKRGNTSPIYTLLFTIDALIDKPEIDLTNLISRYYTEQDNSPVFTTKAIKQDQVINSGRISFIIKNIDNRPQKKGLTYSVQLEPKHNTWTLFRSENQYEFHDLPDDEYTLKVRAKDKEEFVSLAHSFNFEVSGFEKLPQTKIIFDHRLGKGKIVSKVVNICWRADKNGNPNLENMSFSHQLDNGKWSVFYPRTCFELPALSTSGHTFKILGKNRFGIEPVPAIHEFEYQRISDLPLIKLTLQTPDVLEKDSVTFEFKGKDDMEHGDKTPAKELLFSWRLIPEYPGWTQPSPATEISYSNLENGAYFFQVKVVDKKGNECVIPAEKFFEIKVVPFYLKPGFIWSAGIIAPGMAIFFSIIITRGRTKKKIYEQRYNPYVVGEAVHDPEMFFGRQAMMQDIFQSLQNNSLCLTGERRIGKTTLLEHIDKRAQKPLFSFFCNLESVKEGLFFSRIMQHLVNKIQADAKESLPELVLFKKDRDRYDDLDFEDDMENVLAFLKNHYDPRVSIIMCLDEIDATQDFSNELHSSLRNVFQTYQGKIRLVAAGVSIKRGDWHLPTSPWYNFFEFKDISALDKSEAARLITEPVKTFYSYETKAVDFILEKTDGKPFYIQQICKKSIAKILDEKRRRVTQSHVTAIYNDLIHIELNREFETFWEKLSNKLQAELIQAASDSSTTVSKEHADELSSNKYNHGHKVVAIVNEKIRFSAIFKDWLIINYKTKLYITPS
jgi:ligand-binding sensor domain-containing protein